MDASTQSLRVFTTQIDMTLDLTHGEDYVPAGSRFIVDTGKKPVPGSHIFIKCNGGYVMKKMDIRNGKPVLLPTIGVKSPMTEIDDCEIYGVCVSVTREFI